MKNILTSLILLIVLSCKGNEVKPDTIAVDKTENKLKRYDVQSGMITYKTTINGKVMGSVITGNGTEKLFFKDWGAVELVEEESTKVTKMKFFGKEKTDIQKTHTLNKLDNGKSYSVDFKNATIYLRRDPMMELMKNTDIDAGDAGKSMLESMGGKKLGNENFLGYNCEIWDAMGSKQWIYKGVTLKIISKIMGVTTIKEAIKVDFNNKVPNKYFELPDFPITKESGYLSDDEYKAEQEEINKNMDKMRNMSFAEFKKRSQQDPEMKNMSDEELRQNYDLMKKMLQHRK